MSETSNANGRWQFWIERGGTTATDAYVSPILRRYADRVTQHLGGAWLMLMQSNGGLAYARFFHGKDSILSGPAGGVVGAVRTAGLTGYDRIISFGMCGTSTGTASSSKTASLPWPSGIIRRPDSQRLVQLRDRFK